MARIAPPTDIGPDGFDACGRTGPASDGKLGEHLDGGGNPCCGFCRRAATRQTNCTWCRRIRQLLETPDARRRRQG